MLTLLLAAPAGCHSLLPFGQGSVDGAIIDVPSPWRSETRPPTDAAREAPRPGDGQGCFHCVTTVLGSTAGYGGDGPAATALLYRPHAVTIDATTGDWWIADESNHVIRKLSGGWLSTVAGNHQHGCAPGTLAQAMFVEPHQLVLGPSPVSKAYLADAGCHTIWEWTASATGGAVTLLAGASAESGAGFDDKTGSEARFNAPSGVVLIGKSLLVADFDNRRIRKVDTTTRVVETFAGTGEVGCADGTLLAAKFGGPASLHLDSQGQIYVVDKRCGQIRVISGQTVTTIAGVPSSGYADGPAAAAKFNQPSGIALDEPNGLIYVADTMNSCIRVIELQKKTVGTLAGTCAFVPDTTTQCKDGPAKDAQFHWPYGVTLEPSGNLLVADELNNRIRRIQLK